MHSPVSVSRATRRATATLLFVGASIILVPWRLTANETEQRAEWKAVPTDADQASADSPALATKKPDATTKPLHADRLTGRLVVQATLQRKGDDKEMVSGLIGIDPNSGDWKAITQGGHSVRISPESSTLAFEKSSPNFEADAARNDEIWTCDAYTGADARLVAAVGGRPVWSPDGLELVCSGGEVNEEDKKETPEKPVWDVVTWKINHDGGEKTKLPIPSTDFVEDWSPDGQWFVTSSDRHAPYGSGYQLYLMRTDATEQRRLTQGRGLNVYARFSPDGKQVLFLHQEKGKNSIRTIELASGKETTLFEDDGLTRVTFACWSPDGSHLTISREDWELDEKGEAFRGSKDAKPRLAILDLDTKELRELPLSEAKVQWFGHADWK